MAEFPTTRLSLVLAAAAGPDAGSEEALAALCRMYWQPLYAFVRRQGYSHDQAQDLTQSFIARLLEKGALRSFQQERGRFRSFLLGSFKNFLANERDWAHAQKRGGGDAATPIDEVELRDERTPERAFEKQWALSLVNRVMERLREEFKEAGKQDQFARLNGYLTSAGEEGSYRQAARDLEMTEGAVKVAIHRLRLRFHEALRKEISMTVLHPSDVGDEIRYLMTALRG